MKALITPAIERAVRKRRARVVVPAVKHVDGAAEADGRGQVPLGRGAVAQLAVPVVAPALERAVGQLGARKFVYSLGFN